MSTDALGGAWRNGCAAKATMFSSLVNSAPTPGDRALLGRAVAEREIPVTIDTDFGEVLYVHAGLVRLPDVPAERRIALMAEVLERHRWALEIQAVVTIRGDRIRVSQPPASSKHWRLLV